MINWTTTYAAIWWQRKEYLRPVKQIDPIRIEQLLGIETQKQRLIDNTERFLSAQPANNALLWDARLLRTKVAMHTDFCDINKVSKFADTLFATLAYFNGNCLASCSYFLCCFVFLVINS